MWFFEHERHEILLRQAISEIDMCLLEVMNVSLVAIVASVVATTCQTGRFLTVLFSTVSYM